MQSVLLAVVRAPLGVDDGHRYTDLLDRANVGQPCDEHHLTNRQGQTWGRQPPNDSHNAESILPVEKRKITEEGPIDSRHGCL